MSLREEMWKYEQITGESAEHIPIIKLGAFLDGYEMGLKAVEQRPCEDCINRKDAIKHFEDNIIEVWSKEEIADELKYELSSVTPTRPKGKWKRISPQDIYECSECGQVLMTIDIDCYNYCHGCGAKMEVAE